MSYTFLLVALLVQGSLGAPADSTAKTELDNLATKAQSIIDDLTKTIKGSIPESEQVTNVLTTHTQAFAQNVQGLVVKLQEQLKSNKGQIDDTIKDVSNKLGETLTGLQKAAGPEATAKGQKLQQQLDDGLKDTVTQFDKLIKAVQPDVQNAQESVNKFAKGIFDDFVKATQTLQEQVKTSLQQS